MQAHANDLRAEVKTDWDTVLRAQASAPDVAALDAFVHQVVDDWRQCSLSMAVRRLVEFAEKVTRAPAEVNESDVGRLRDAGWCDETVHDAVQVIAYFNYINRVASALGVEPEENLPRWGKG